jgi:hypothetical protein
MIQISVSDASPFLTISETSRRVANLVALDHSIVDPAVEVKGLEPMTLCLQSRCSPN